MHEECATCSIKDVCGGDAEKLMGHLGKNYGEFIAVLGLAAAIAENGSSFADSVMTLFAAGYMARAHEERQERVDTPDMSIWGECFKE